MSRLKVKTSFLSCCHHSDGLTAELVEYAECLTLTHIIGISPQQHVPILCSHSKAGDLALP